MIRTGPRIQRQRHRLTPGRISSVYGVTSIAAGGAHAGAISPTSLWMWGKGGQGQLGNGLTLDVLTPTIISLPSSNDTKLNDSMFQELVCGETFSVARDSESRVWSWGGAGSASGGTGQALNAPMIDSLVKRNKASLAPEFSWLRPQAVHALAGAEIVQLSAGGTRAGALSRDGQVFLWGQDHALPTLVSFSKSESESKEEGWSRYSDIHIFTHYFHILIQISIFRYSYKYSDIHIFTNIHIQIFIQIYILTYHFHILIQISIFRY